MENNTPKSGFETTAPRVPVLAMQIYDILEPLDAATRSKVLQGVFGMLGDGPVELRQSETPGHKTNPGDSSGSQSKLGKKAALWMQRNDLTDAHVESVFHIDGDKVEVIGSPPGKTKREMTINAYLLSGVRGLLATDESRFTEAEAVALCKKQGCYDNANHSITRGLFGNRISGTKDTGYALTNPGHDDVAKLVKSMGSPKKT